MMKISDVIDRLRWAKEHMGDLEIQLEECPTGELREIQDVLLFYIGSEWDDCREKVIPAIISMAIKKGA